MNVASKKLCEELYAVSGWINTQNYWKSLIGHDVKTWSDWQVVDFNSVTIPEAFGERTYPAYDLGFLLRKLPLERESVMGEPIELHLRYDGHEGHWLAEYTDGDFIVLEPELIGEADTPENALIKLAIELFKSGVLTK